MARSLQKNKSIKEVNREIINDVIDTIYVHESGNITIKFKYEDEFMEAIDFIKREKYDIMLKNVV